MPDDRYHIILNQHLHISNWVVGLWIQVLNYTAVSHCLFTVLNDQLINKKLNIHKHDKMIETIWKIWLKFLVWPMFHLLTWRERFLTYTAATSRWQVRCFVFVLQSMVWKCRCKVTVCYHVKNFDGQNWKLFFFSYKLSTKLLSCSELVGIKESLVYVG